MPMSNYSEKLKSPKWQKKRLEILQRDEFTCQSCLSKINTLHVHHFAYKQGLEPWEYENDMLQTLCEDCHYLKNSKSISMDIHDLSRRTLTEKRNGK